MLVCVYARAYVNTLYVEAENRASWFSINEFDGAWILIKEKKETRRYTTVIYKNGILTLLKFIYVREYIYLEAENIVCWFNMKFDVTWILTKKKEKKKGMHWLFIKITFLTLFKVFLKNSHGVLTTKNPSQYIEISSLNLKFHDNKYFSITKVLQIILCIFYPCYKTCVWKGIYNTLMQKNYYFDSRQMTWRGLGTNKNKKERKKYMYVVIQKMVIYWSFFYLVYEK